jgi:hypothetical protein
MAAHYVLTNSKDATGRLFPTPPAIASKSIEVLRISGGRALQSLYSLPVTCRSRSSGNRRTS